MGRKQEAHRQLRITYQLPIATAHGTYMEPVGQAIVVDRPKASHRATRADGRIIAEAALRIAAGTDFGSLVASRGIIVEEVRFAQDGTELTSPLHGWDDKAGAFYRKAVRRLSGGFLGEVMPETFGELAGIRKRARKEGVAQAEQARKERGDDKGFTLGKRRARIYARLTRGRDASRLIHELAPGQSLERLQRQVYGVLRRRQDGDGDAGNIVHGVGAKGTEIIKKLQKGGIGILLTLVQARNPEIKAAFETAFTLEKWTSADDTGSKVALSLYEGAYDVATEAIHKHIGGDKNPEANNEGSVLRRHVKRRFWKTVRGYTNAALVPSVAVTEEELDRRQERKDRVASRYMSIILNDSHATDKSLAYQRHRQDLAVAVTQEMERPRNDTELYFRGLEEKVVDHLAPVAHLLPVRIIKIVERFMGEESVPADYTEALKELKEIEVNEPTLVFINKVFELAFGKPSEDGKGIVKKGFIEDERLSEETRILWRQAAHYSVEMKSLYQAALKLTRPASPNTK